MMNKSLPKSVRAMFCLVFGLLTAWPVGALLGFPADIFLLAAIVIAVSNLCWMILSIFVEAETRRPHRRRGRHEHED